MGQIVGGAAKPKRCNLNKLSQLGTPAAGEHILVSSDNSMNAAGQGNFDSYVKGNGTTAAENLVRYSINRIFFSGKNIGYVKAGDGKNTNDSGWRHSEYVPFEDDLTLNNIYIANTGGTAVGLCVYDAYKNYIGYVSATTSGWQNTFTLQKSNYPNAHYIRFSTTPAKNGYCFVNIANSFSRIIDELQKICVNTYGNFFSIEGYLLKADGTLYSSSGKYVTDYIPIDITNDLIVYGYGYSTTYVPICYYDENFQFLGKVTPTKSAAMDLYVVSSENIPTGTKYIRCSASSKDIGFVITNVSNAIVKDLNSLRNEMKDNIGGSELRTILKDFDFVDNRYHYYTQNSGYKIFYGSDSVTPGFHCTSRIPISVGDVIISNCARGNGQVCNIYFDSDGQPIGRFDVGSATPSTFTIPQSAWDDGARYIALSFGNTTVPSLEIKHNYNAYDAISSIENTVLKKVTFPSSSFYGKSPEAFKDKLIAAEQDIEILLLGDSMTAQTNTAGPVFSDASHLPAGCNRDAITYQLWDLLCKNKPLCDRFDSVRDNSNVFTESGTWNLSSVAKQNYDNGVSGSNTYGEFSEDNCIYRESADSNAYVEFDWNLADYEKLYFIHRLSQCDGTTEVTISCAAGKVEVYNLQNGSWVEANGFTFSQKLTATDTYNARWIRNYPLKMRRKAVTDETVTIRLTNTGSGTFYYWGTERWNFTTLRITNIARAGRTIELLRRSISEELSLRSVDLVIFQLPLWNNFGQISANGRNPLTDGAYPTLSSLTNILNDFKSLSDNFTKFQVICNLYHTSLYSWDGNKNLPFVASSTNVKTSDCDYNLEMQCMKHIKDYASTNNAQEYIYVANLIGELYRLVCLNHSTMSYALSQINTHRLFGEQTLTIDGVHPTSTLFGLYANMISSMFEY